MTAGDDCAVAVVLAGAPALVPGAGAVAGAAPVGAARVGAVVATAGVTAGASCNAGGDGLAAISLKHGLRPSVRHF